MMHPMIVVLLNTIVRITPFTQMAHHLYPQKLHSKESTESLDCFWGSLISEDRYNKKQILL